MTSQAGTETGLQKNGEGKVMQPSYLYKATVVRVIDGDSVVFDVDCGFDLS